MFINCTDLLQEVFKSYFVSILLSYSSAYHVCRCANQSGVTYGTTNQRNVALQIYMIMLGDQLHTEDAYYD